ncbi:MAG TPA: protein kinase, partial [Myxococcaceae bacterium]|nr:protein kinase [Myxococcaceae bacterium]
MACLTEDELVELAEGTLAGEAARAAQEHLASCQRCRTLVGELAHSLASIDATTLPRTAPPELTRGTELGRYIVLERLGMGGMGVVYAAYDPTLDRRVALKLLTAEPALSTPAEGGRDRLLREAQSLAQLSHPNVVAIHDVGSWNGQVFLAMELLTGGTLKEWLRKERHPWRQVLQVFRDAGRGLISAHAAGLVHRDFKPDNVLIGLDGRVRVVDFGLARPVEELDGSNPSDES